MFETGLFPSTEKLLLLAQYYHKFLTIPEPEPFHIIPLSTPCVPLFIHKHAAIYMFDGTTPFVILCSVHFTKLLTHVKIVHSHFFFTSNVKEGIIFIHSSPLYALNSCIVLRCIVVYLP